MIGMRKTEAWALVLGALAAAALLASFYAGTTLVRHLDSVFLLETLDSIVATGQPVSATVASWPEVTRTLGMTAEQLCALPLGFPGARYNIMHNHAYLALYPMALLTRFVGAEWGLALLNSAAHLALVFVPYLFLRRRGVGLLPAAAFSLCVVCYPGWSLSASGDYYLDRLYMPFMLALLYLLHGLVSGEAGAGRGYRLVAVVCAAIFTALFTERAAIMVIAALGFFWLMFPAIRRDAVTNRALVGVAVVLVAYLAYYFRFVYQGFESSGGLLANAQLTPAALKARLAQPGMIPFALTNLLFLGWMALFAGWRYVLLLLGAMAPNILITTGGAELNGWSTHYHAMYIPFLVFAASAGFLALCRRLDHVALKVGMPVLTGVLVIVVSSYFNPFSAQWAKEFGDTGFTRITKLNYRYFLAPERSGERAMVQWLGTLDDGIPPHAKVSAVEGAMPALYRSHRLAMYPFGMDTADFLVISGSAVNGVPTVVSGANNYVEPDKVNACLAKRAAAQGFVFDRDVPAVGALIFRRHAG